MFIIFSSLEKDILLYISFSREENVRIVLVMSSATRKISIFYDILPKGEDEIFFFLYFEVAKDIIKLNLEWIS